MSKSLIQVLGESKALRSALELCGVRYRIVDEIFNDERVGATKEPNFSTIASESGAVMLLMYGVTCF